jgi:hypothetical protein
LLLLCIEYGGQGMDFLESKSTTDLLETAYILNTDEDINIGSLLESISDGGFALLNLLCGIILMIPTPPPIAIVMGLTIMLFSCQMALGYKKVWLPKYITTKSIPRKYIGIAIQKSSHYIKRLEAKTKKRFVVILTRPAKKLAAIFMFVLAAVTLSPLIFANTIPGAGIILISFGILNNDGILVSYGYIVGFIGIIVSCAIAWFGALAIFHTIRKIIHWL